jgi:hypothetical protein
MGGSRGDVSGGAPSGASGPGISSGAPPTGGGGTVAQSGGTAGTGATSPVAGASNGGGASDGGATRDAGSTGGSGFTGECEACTLGLDPPAPADGFQLASPGSIALNPGEESFVCYYKNVPGKAEVNAGAFRSLMQFGVHDFITFLDTGTGTGVFGGGPKQPEGTLRTCTFGGGQWLYAASPGTYHDSMDLPRGVAIPLPSGSQIILNMHLLNTRAEIVYPSMKLNVLYAQQVQYKAATMVSYNEQISVPPQGAQTVKGACTPATNSKFFLFTTHTHGFATSADVNYLSGGQTTNLVHTTNWENPASQVWTAPNFLQTQAGDTFTYGCSYENPTTPALTVGDGIHSDVCVAVGYFFPAATTICN